MMIRNAKPEELDVLMPIFEGAKAFMCETGNANQWKEYPPRELIAADIARGECFVLEDEDGIQGVFVLSFRRDEEYELPEAGFDDGEYATIHRLASTGRRRGVFQQTLDYCTARADCFRVDTHVENRIIREKLAAYGFREKGELYRHSERFLTFEWRRMQK